MYLFILWIILLGKQSVTHLYFRS